MNPFDDIVNERFPCAAQAHEVWVPRSSFGIRKCIQYSLGY
jgi:hypothetical protein